MTQPDTTPKVREKADPKAKAQAALAVIDRKIERENKHLAQAESVVTGARQALSSLQREREYAAQHPALQEPVAESGRAVTDSPQA